MTHWFDPDRGSRWHRLARGGSGSGGGGAPQTTTTTQNNDPWSGQQDYLKFGFQQAQDQYNSGKPAYFPGQTVADFNPTQNAALAMGTNRALTGSPTLGAAQNEATKTLNGDYLSAGNPYTQQLSDSIYSQVRPQVDSQFSGANRYGSAGHEGAMTSAFTNALAAPMFNQYGNERQQMGAMTTQAPSLAASDYNDINTLGQIGLTQQQQDQNQINANVDRFNFGENTPANKLAQYMQQIGGQYGGQSTQTTTAPAPGKGGSPTQDIGNVANAASSAAIAYKVFSHPSFKDSNETAPSVLDKLSEIKIEAWKYKSYMGLGRASHIGPYADQFKDVFGVGDGVTLDPVDMFGIMFKAMQELTAEVRSLKEATHGR